MNWKRGLLRLWAIVSIAWIGGVVAVLNPIPKIVDPLATYKEKFRITGARAAGYHDEEIAAFLSRQALIDFGEKALIPPMALLALGFGGSWILRGFKS